MKRTALIFTMLFCLLAVARPSGAQETGVTQLPLVDLSENNLSFGDGELLDYTFTYRWGLVNTDVAHGSLAANRETSNGRALFHTRMFARTAKFFDSFFKVREDFNSWASADGLKPWRFTRDTKEGGYWCKNELEFFPEARPPHIASTFETAKKGVRKAEMPIETRTFDVISLIYAIRNIDMGGVEPGVPYGITFAVDDDIYNIALIFRQKENKNIKGLGSVPTMRFDVSVIAGEVFSGEESLSLWMTDDDNRVPVYFEAAIKIGKVYGRLVSAKGLKHQSVLK